MGRSHRNLAALACGVCELRLTFGHLLPVARHQPRTMVRGVSARPAGAWWRTVAAVVVTCLPVAATCATLAAAAFAVVRPGTLDYAEPVIYGQALRVVWGQPLYQPIDTPPLTVAAYTPLFY